MAALTLVQTNFTAGELSQRLYGRMDLDRYQNGAKEITNGVVLVQGGIKKRGGTLHVAYAKHAGTKTRLIRYVFSKSQAYMLELGHYTMRVFTDSGQVLSGGVPYEIATPYPESALFELDYVQGADTLFIAHQGYPMRTLKRYGHTDWRLELIAFDPEPFDELTPSPAFSCDPQSFDASGIDPVGTVITLTLSGNGWTAADVGKHVKINRGLVKITAYTSATVVSGVIKQQLDSDIAAPSGSWTLNASVWGGANGYPGTVTLHQQRLFAAGSPGYPQTIWASYIGEYYGFESGLDDAEGFSFTVVSDEMNAILHLAQTNTLLALTAGGEFTIEGGQSKPITPTNIQVKWQGASGARDVRSWRVGNEMIYVHRSGRRVLGMAYRFDTDSQGSTDLSILANHLVEAGIVDMAYAGEPDSTLWLVREDGILLSLTLNREQQVVAWARHDVGGVVESVASVPDATGADQLWLSVRRTVNGVTARRIERMSETVYCDAAITGSHATGAATWTGLSHLEGKVVTVLADGEVMPSVTVTAGQITLPRTALDVVIGLSLICRVVTLTAEVNTPQGSGSAGAQRISEVTLRLLNSTRAHINGQAVTFSGGRIGVPLAPFTGDYRMETLGFNRGRGEVEIVHDDPLPFLLQAVIKKMAVNNG